MRLTLAWRMIATYERSASGDSKSGVAITNADRSQMGIGDPSRLNPREFKAYMDHHFRRITVVRVLGGVASKPVSDALASLVDVEKIRRAMWRAVTYAKG